MVIVDDRHLVDPGSAHQPFSARGQVEAGEREERGVANNECGDASHGRPR
jgi:hypothetical protein